MGQLEENLSLTFTSAEDQSPLERNRNRLQDWKFIDQGTRDTNASE